MFRVLSIAKRGGRSWEDKVENFEEVESWTKSDR
jgi:hypothetical protein